MSAARSARSARTADRLIRRYEPIALTLVAIAVVVRLSGGGVVGFAPPAAALPTATSAGVTPPGPSTGPVSVAPPPPAQVPTVTPTGVAPAPVVVSSGPPPATNPPAPAPSPAPHHAVRWADGGQFGAEFTFAAIRAPGRPAAVAIGPGGDVWLGTDPSAASGGPHGPARLLHFNAAGRLEAAIVLRHVTGVTGVALRAGKVFLTAVSPAAVLVVHSRTHRIRTYATVPDVAPCIPPLVTTNCDGSVDNAAPLPTALAFDPRGRLYVADAAQAAIWRVPARGGSAQEWAVDSTWNNPTRPSGPTGIAVDGAGNLVVTIASTLAQDDGLVLLQHVASDGSPGSRSQLADTGAGSRPDGIALSATGRMYVSLAGPGHVLVLTRTGSVAGSTPSSSSPALSTPRGLAFRGRSLLVAEESPDDPTAGRVVRLPAGEEGGRLW